jgi:cytochrome P450
MAAAALPTLEEARARASEVPLKEINVAHWDHFESDTIAPYFERLRREAPVHYCTESAHGGYGSIPRFEDVRAVNIDYKRFSSDTNVTLVDQPTDFESPMFIAMDPPKHEDQRKVVRPAVAQRNVRKLEPTIRERAASILDALPIGEDFDWVEHVSIELTTQMRATLFDFPFEDRHKLTRAGPMSPPVDPSRAWSRPRSNEGKSCWNASRPSTHSSARRRRSRRPMT